MNEEGKKKRKKREVDDEGKMGAPRGIDVRHVRGGQA
jgi:hypothetical protein